MNDDEVAGSQVDDRRWCILRTGGQRTLALVRSLRAAGIDVWTPTVVLKRRRARSRIKVERDAPLLPTFAFARGEYLPDLVTIEASPVSPHPDFSILRRAGDVPLIKDWQMTSLRDAERAAWDERAREKERERRADLRKRGEVPPIGTRVRVARPAFTGMTGIVEGEKGRAAIVNFGGGLTVNIEAWLLAPDGIGAMPA